jgi:hypothetical protein
MIEANKRTQLAQQEMGLRSQKAQMELDEVNRAKADREALAASARGTMPGGGPNDAEFDPANPAPPQKVVVPTREQQISYLQQHAPHLVAGVQKAHADIDAANEKVKQAKIEGLGQIAYGGLKAGIFTPSAAGALLQEAEKGGYISQQDQQDLMTRATLDPSIIEPTLRKMVAASSLRDSLSKDETAAATAARDKETGRHNTAMENRPIPVGPGNTLFSPTGAQLGSVPKEPTYRAPVAQDWVIRNGVTTPIAPGTARPGDIPTTASVEASRRGADVPEALKSGLTGDEFLATLDPATARSVKALAEGRTQVTARAQTDPQFKQLLQYAQAYDPDFDTGNYNARNKARTDFTSGKSAQTINALSTAIGHVHELQEKAKGFGYTNSPDMNALINWASAKVGSGKPGSYEMVRNAVGEELTRVWRQAGGTEADIAAWKEGLSAASSPEGFKDAFRALGSLLESKLTALETQRDTALGRFGADIPIVTPQTRQRLDAMQGVKAKTAPVAAPPAATPAAPAGSSKVGRFTVTEKK